MSRIVILGAGAAGLMAAWHAADGDDEVILLERTPNGARKILISGGGRCNILPLATDPARFGTRSSPHSLRKMLLSWPVAGQREFFEREIGIELATEEGTGKVFPASNSAREVRERLLDAVQARGVEVRMTSRVTGLEPGWKLRIADVGILCADRVVLATGGLSIPGTGSDGIGLRLAKELGHEIVEPCPALTPLRTDDPDWTALSGLSLEVELRVGEGREQATGEGSFLFTHRGFSGPVVLDLSHHMILNPERKLRVNWVRRPREELDESLRASGSTRIRTTLREILPSRLVDTILRRLEIDSQRRCAELARADRQRLVETLTACELRVSGHEGYGKAEVTAGGVALREVDPRTMQSRRHAGLFFCGEILDAFGPIGGHNFAWAWATGRAAGLGARGD